MFKDITFTEDELHLICNNLKKITLKRREFLLREEEEVNSIHYIHRGCLRTYFIDTSGKEHTLQFAIQGWWISDYIALYAKEKTKSVSYIECIKEATLLKISKKDFDNLCEDIPKISHFYIKNLESAFAAFQKRILENLTMSAKERYLNFVNSYPNIEQNVKNYHIASFLGITTESLSRIRKEIANQ
ncbi:MAG: Crp/Fnr family transcriptional regulator [Aureispira sp.]|nr:Crp/Fnr family transcriptional regulator [Aureispira sp.]